MNNTTETEDAYTYGAEQTVARVQSIVGVRSAVRLLILRSLIQDKALFAVENVHPNVVVPRR